MWISTPSSWWPRVDPSRPSISPPTTDSSRYKAAIFRQVPDCLWQVSLTIREREARLVLRAKRRPVLVLSTGGTEVPRPLRVGAARYQTNPTLIAAPYYGADQGGSSGGWKPEFVERIRRCEYPQYMWDKLPLSGRDESILRLDQFTAGWAPRLVLRADRLPTSRGRARRN